MTRFYECRYVRRGDPGDLVYGYCWRPAILVDEMPHEGEIFHYTDYAEIESCMYDKETGEPVGDTANFCVNPNCWHTDCAPLTLIYEDDNER